MTDIVDRIDQLVDEQLAGGEPRIGFNFGDPQFPDCPHCDRKWHGIAITERVARMYDLGHYDNDYRVDTDESPVLCRGSDFIGPMPMESGYGFRAIAQFTNYVTGVLFYDLSEAMQELTNSIQPLAEFARTFQLDPPPSGYTLGVQEGAPYYPPFTPDGFYAFTTEGFTEIGTLEE